MMTLQGSSVSVLADGYRRLAEELKIPVCLTQVLITIVVDYDYDL